MHRGGIQGEHEHMHGMAKTYICMGCEWFGGASVQDLCGDFDLNILERFVFAMIQCISKSDFSTCSAS